MSAATSRRPSSGEHPAVIAFRRKLDSIAEHDVPVVEELRERAERLKSDRPPRDERREDSGEIPIDVVFDEEQCDG